MTDMNTGMPYWWVGENPMNVLPPNQALAQNLAQNTAMNQASSQAVSAASAQSEANSQNMMNWSRGINDNTSRITNAAIAANLAVGNRQPTGTYKGNALSPFATGTAPIQHLGGTNGLQPFNPGSYYLKNPDVWSSGADAWKHWNQFGQNEGRQGAWGNTTFDTSNYLANNPDVWKAGADPMQHWLLSGYNEGRKGAWGENLFDKKNYLAHNPDVAAAGVDPTAHWYQIGNTEGRTGGFGETPFNKSNYLANNPDVWKAGADPWQHWVGAGWKEGRTGAFGENPFNAPNYLAHNPDVAATGMDPTAHWYQFGANEGRQGAWGGDAFNAQEYRLQNRDVAAAGVDPLQHWLQAGWKEGREAAFGGTEASDWDNYFTQATRGGGGANTGRDALAAEYFMANRDVFKAAQASGRDPTEFGLEHLMNYAATGEEDRGFFDRDTYLEKYKDVAASGMDPSAHWYQFGQNEGRDNPIAHFNYGEYLRQNPDVLASGMDPLAHWTEFGSKEKRTGAYQSTLQNLPVDQRLAAQRAGVGAALEADPSRKLMIAVKLFQELQNDSVGRVGVFEAMMNRMNATGQNMLNPAYYPRDAKSLAYNAVTEAKLRANPALLNQIYAEMARAIAGSNISNYATDWGMDVPGGPQVAATARKYSTPTWNSPGSTEEFFRKDLPTLDSTGKSWAGLGNVANNIRWYEAVTGTMPH